MNLLPNEVIRIIDKHLFESNFCLVLDQLVHQTISLKKYVNARCTYWNILNTESFYILRCMRCSQWFTFHYLDTDPDCSIDNMKNILRNKLTTKCPDHKDFQ